MYYLILLTGQKYKLKRKEKEIKTKNYFETNQNITRKGCPVGSLL